MSYFYSTSAHPLNIGVRGPTGVTLATEVRTGPRGKTGATGNVGSSGPTGSIGVTLIGITYASTFGAGPFGGKPYHLINIFSNGVTTDGGYFRGPTGPTNYWLAGENIGKATGGAMFQKVVNGELFIKSITGGGGVRVVDEGGTIRVKYKTFDAVNANGVFGQLVFFNKNFQGATGLSGATLTHFHAGPTFSLDYTGFKTRDVSGFIRPSEYDCSTHTLIYKINPYELFTLNAARNSTSPGNIININLKDDYVDMTGDTSSDVPFIRIVDTSQSYDDDWSDFFGYQSACSFTIVMNTSENGNRGTRVVPDFCPSNSGDTVKVSELTFPSNWKFPRNANPVPHGGIDIIQFVSIGTRDNATQKAEWYGMYVSSRDNPFKPT